MRTTTDENSFEAMWEVRAHAVAVALADADVVPQERFRQTLIAEISRWQQQERGADEWRYYDRWLSALERVLTDGGLLDGEAIDTRHRELAAGADTHHR